MKSDKEWMAAMHPEHLLDCVCARCKRGLETFLLPEDIQLIQADALRHAAEICLLSSNAIAARVLIEAEACKLEEGKQ